MQVIYTYILTRDPRTIPGFLELAVRLDLDVNRAVRCGRRAWWVEFTGVHTRTLLVLAYGEYLSFVDRRVLH